MKNFFRVFFALAISILFPSCSQKSETVPLIIASDVWIGSAPLYYAHAAGWLKEANIEILLADSMNDTQRMYDLHASSLFTGTQHEYLRAKKKHPDLVPIIIYDRSYGGDLILSNRTLDMLNESNETITIYVEFDTVGEDMIRYFINETHFSENRFNVINRHLEEIESLRDTPSSPPTLIVTYNPHDILPRKHGFTKIADSKDERYLVIDGIYTSLAIYRQYPERLALLKSAIDRANEVYKKRPEEFYAKVKPYLHNLSYSEFKTMEENIRWIDHDRLTPEMLLRIKDIGIPTETLIR